MFAHAALAATLALLSAPSALAHVGMFHPSLYGFNASGREPEHWYDQDVNNDFTRNPLRLMDNLKFDEWWFHGLRGAKPNAVMQLPAGGKVNIEMSCNKAFTSYTTRQDQLDLVGDMPCMINQDANGRPHYGDPNVPASNGPLHVADKSDAKGCALAIAYTNDVYSITPKTFTVFSVNHTCVWTRNTQFEIPADMPPCPNGRCICSWNWIHGGDRGQGLANELYMNGFDCNIVNAKKNAPKLATPKTAKLCKDEPEKCVKGAKQGLYWQGAVADGWNVPLNESTRDPPFYNEEWGFKDGAQNDIFDRSQEVARVSNVKQNAIVQDEKTSTKETKAQASTATPKATPTASPTKVAEAIQAPADVANTEIAVGFAREAIVTQTVVVTRTHLVVVTEEASPLSSKRSIKRSKRHDKRRLEARHGLGFSS